MTLRRKRAVIAGFILVISLSCVVFLFQAPLVLNTLGRALEGTLGYRFIVRDFSISPGIHGTIEGLQVTDAREGAFSLVSSRVNIKSELTHALKGEVERLTITSPAVSLRMGEKAGKTDFGFLKKLPPVGLLTIKNGTLNLSFVASSHVIKLQNINLEAKGFSPEKGGNFIFNSSVHISSGDNEGISGNGWCKGVIQLTSLVPEPKGKGSIEINLDSGRYGDVSLKKARLNFTIDLQPDTIVMHTASVDIAALSFRQKGKETTITDFVLKPSVSYGIKSKNLSLHIAGGDVARIGKVDASLNGIMAGDFPWKGSLQASAVSFSGISAFIKPLLGDEYRKWMFEGRGDLNMHMEGTYDGKQPAGSGTMSLIFEKGGFRSPDSTKAGQGISGEVVLRLQLPSGHKKAGFKLSSTLSPAEFLWGAYYKDFSKEQVRLSAQGSFFLTELLPLEVSGELDLFTTGEYSFSGSIGMEQSNAVFFARKISHQRISSIFVVPYLTQIAPELSSLQISGESEITVKTVAKKESMCFSGRMNTADASLSIPGLLFALEKVNIDLPFSQSRQYPADCPAEDDKAPAGSLRIGRMTFNRGTVNDLHIPVSLSQNSLTIHSSVTLPFFGGIISVSDLSGKSIVSSDRKFHFGLQARDIDLASLTHSAGDIPCRLQAEFTEVRYEGGIWTATGKVSAQIFGGVVEAANLHGKDIFVSSRRVGADIHFRDIDLEGLSSALKFGKMTGSLEGQMRNFEMEYGQPARFVLDVDSVERKGVDKKISVDAVENITILGTGSEGMESILKSGINRFFKEYPYSRLGIRCTLENDVFTVRGKIVEDGVEYLIRKGFLRGIDVVNMNPNNTISFKDMQERVNRISNKQEAYQQ